MATRKLRVSYFDKLFDVEVKDSDTIYDFKRKIEDQSGFLIDRHILFVNLDTLQDDDAPVSSINTDDIVLLLSIVEVQVKLPDDQEMNMEVNVADCVGSIMGRIQQTQGIRVSSQELVFQGEILDHEEKIMSYDFKQNSLIKVNLIQPANIADVQSLLTLLEFIASIGGTNLKSIMQARLTDFHMTSDAMIICTFTEFLTDEEKDILNKKGEKIQVNLITPDLETIEMGFTTYDNTGRQYLLGSQWIYVRNKYDLKEGQRIQLWSFRQTGKLAFALHKEERVKKDENQGTAEEKPSVQTRLEEFIASAEGYNLMLIMAKRLIHLDMTSEWMTIWTFSDFLTDEEKGKLSHSETIDVRLIAPDFEIVKMGLMRAPHHSGLQYLMGPQWVYVRTKNDLKEGDKIQLWSFRESGQPRLALCKEEHVDKDGNQGPPLKKQRVLTPLERFIDSIGGTNLKMISEKRLIITDTTSKEMTFSSVLTFLTHEEEIILEKPETIEVKFVNPDFKIGEMGLRRGHSSGNTYLLVSNWEDMREKYQLQHGQNIQLWSFRENGKLGLALGMEE